MADIRMTTYRDLVGHILDYMGGSISDEINLRKARRAVLAAYASTTRAKMWSYYRQMGHVLTVASQTTGTITYTHSTRAVTLASSTWPSWAALGTILIDNQAYDIATRDSTTQLTLSLNNNPGANVAAGTSYSLVQDTYALPCDLISVDELVNMTIPSCMDYLEPSAWLALHRVYRGAGIPDRFTITRHPKYHGLLALRVYPAPSQILRFEFVYRRQPRALVVDLYETGTCTVSSLLDSLTGNGTTWTSGMVGAVVRISTSSTDAPTSPAGDNPALVERTVTAYTGETALTMDAAPGVDKTAVKYTISDPVDVESGAMATLLLRECERQARMICRLTATEYEEAQFVEAERMAWEADSRSSERKVSGQGGGYWINPKYLPNSLADTH